jgi:hypothetical protein
MQNFRRPQGNAAARSQSNVFLDLFRNQKQLGAVLLAAGILLSFMGIMLFFEGNLLRLGNVSCGTCLCF